MSIKIQNRLTEALYHVLFASGAARLLRRSDAVVFCYHNVISDELHGRVGDRYLHTSLTDFSDQLKWIADSYEVVPIGEIVRRLRDGKSLGGLAAISFDDGYAGVVRNAVPLMRAADVPFAIFPVVEGATNRRPFWWDVVREVETDRELYLTEWQGDHKRILEHFTETEPLPDEALPAGWAEIQTVLGDDCTIGVHTVTHRNLAALPRDDVRWEITHARSRLEAELGVVSTIVSYPYGRSNGTVQDETKSAGFEAAFGLASNLIDDNASTLDVPRINVPAGIALPSFACWSSGLKLRR